MHLLYLQLVIVFSLISFLFIKVSKKLKLYDNPKGRRNHSKPVLFIGGIIINFCFMYFIKIENSIFIIELIYIYALLICLIGLIDDILILSASGKITLLSLPIFF